MPVKYRAILLKKVNYGDRNLILQTYSCEQGGLSFFAGNSLFRGKSKSSLPLLSCLEIVAAKGRGALLRVKELEHFQVNSELLSDMNKASVVIFLNEILLRTIRDYGTDESLFDFIVYSLKELDSSPSFNPDFHLIFLLKLTRHLGLSPHDALDDSKKYFDLYEGEYCEAEPIHGHFIPPDLSQRFGELVRSATNSRVTKSKNERRQLLDHVINYYRLHVDNFDEIKSKEILEVVLH